MIIIEIGGGIYLLRKDEILFKHVLLILVVGTSTQPTVHWRAPWDAGCVRPPLGGRVILFGLDTNRISFDYLCE